MPRGWLSEDRAMLGAVVSSLFVVLQMAVLQQLAYELREMVQGFNIIARSYFSIFILQVSWWTSHSKRHRRNTLGVGVGVGGIQTACQHLKPSD